MRCIAPAGTHSIPPKSSGASGRTGCDRRQRSHGPGCGRGDGSGGIRVGVSEARAVGVAASGSGASLSPAGWAPVAWTGRCDGWFGAARLLDNPRQRLAAVRAREVNHGPLTIPGPGFRLKNPLRPYKAASSCHCWWPGLVRPGQRPRRRLRAPARPTGPCVAHVFADLACVDPAVAVASCSLRPWLHGGRIDRRQGPIALTPGGTRAGAEPENESGAVARDRRPCSNLGVPVGRRPGHRPQVLAL